MMRNALALVAALLVACGTSASPSPAAASVPSQQPPATAAPTPASKTSPAIPTRNPANAEVLLRWAPGVNIADVDDVSDIVTRLKNTPGIVDGFGDETQITILYDPQQITTDRIRRILADMGFPTQP